MRPVITPARKREYPTKDGWKYITIEDIKRGLNKEQIIRNLTKGFPMLYEIPFYHRTDGTAFIIMRRKPVKQLKAKN